MAFDTLRNSAFSAFLVGQQAARLMRENTPNANGAKGTIIFTNASAALKGFPLSGAFAMACHAKSGLAQSMARELMPQGIHVANVPIDAAIGWTQEDGTRSHRRAGTTVHDNMADPDYIAETYLQLHRQHRSTWAFEVVLRPWVRRSGDPALRALRSPGPEKVGSRLLSLLQSPPASTFSGRSSPEAKRLATVAFDDGYRLSACFRITLRTTTKPPTCRERLSTTTRPIGR